MGLPPCTKPISASPAGSRLVDCAWDYIQQELGPKAGALRQVSHAWREDTGRALNSVHLVDPCPSMLASTTRQFPGLRSLAVTLTHPWPEQPLESGLAPRPANPESGRPETTGRQVQSAQQLQQQQQQQQWQQGTLHCVPISNLTELSVHGWAGACASCEQRGPHANAQPAPEIYTRHGRCVPDVPGPLLVWAAAAGKLRVLRITRCAAPTPALLQGCLELRELHLINVDFNAMAMQTPGAKDYDTTCSPFVAALASLPHLVTLSLQQHDPGLLGAPPRPCLAGLHTLRSLTSLSLAASSALLMQAAAQVAGWDRLSVLHLEAVQWQYRDPQPTELHHLLAAMAPGAKGLASFSCSGHTYVSDRCLSALARLFPALRNVALPLDEYAQDSTWNPFMQSTPPGDLHGPVGLSGLQYLLHGRQEPLLGLHLGHVPLETDALMAILSVSSLEQLDLSGCAQVDDTMLYRLCAGLRHLKHLGLSGCTAVSDIGLAQLGAALPHLTYLDISDCAERVTNLGISRLAGLRRLASLNMSGCHKVTDEGLRALLGRRQHDALSQLNLSCCFHLTDTSLSLLARNAPYLTRLSLDALTSITAPGILQLSSLLHLHKLSVAWCADPVQAAAASLACHVMGQRLGPLMIVPPGTLEAGYPPCSAPRLIGTQDLCKGQHATSCGRECGSLGSLESTSAGSTQGLREESSVVSDVSGVSEGGEASEGSELPSVSSSGASSMASSPVQRAPRLKASGVCVGFVPLSDSGPGYQRPWWLNGL